MVQGALALERSVDIDKLTVQSSEKSDAMRKVALVQCGHKLTYRR